MSPNSDDGFHTVDPPSSRGVPSPPSPSAGSSHQPSCGQTTHPSSRGYRNCGHVIDLLLPPVLQGRCFGTSSKVVHKCVQCFLVLRSNYLHLVGNLRKYPSRRRSKAQSNPITCETTRITPSFRKEVTHSDGGFQQVDPSPHAPHIPTLYMSPITCLCFLFQDLNAKG